MGDDLVLAIDQGTTNTKAVLLDRLGIVVREVSERVPVQFPRPGWVESDARHLWSTVQAAVSGCLEGVAPGDVAAMGISNQRESVVAWDRGTGEPLGPCISWQCRRTADRCSALRSGGAAPMVRARTGLGIDPMFSATKAAWLLDAIENGRARAARGDVLVGTVDTWLLWNLTEGADFATDATNASRTLLMDLDQLRWDEELLALFDIPAAALPELRATSTIQGSTVGRGAIPPGIPIAALVGDSHAALFGHGAPGPGTVKATFGTGTSVMAPVAEPIRSEVLSSTVAWVLDPSATSSAGGSREVVYALEGNIVATGAAIEWVATMVGLDGREGELEGLALSVPDAAGIVLVPAFSGLGAPHWDAAATGLICGITRATTHAHLARAVFDAVAFQVRDVLEALRPSIPSPLETLVVDGGAMRSDLLARTVADVTGVPVMRTRAANLSARGAAYLAGLAVGFWDSQDEIRRLSGGYDRFLPSAQPGDVEARYGEWQVALGRAAGATTRTLVDQRARA